jgi:DNA modification methylase
MSMRIRDLKVHLMESSALKPYGHNARKHSKRHVRQIAEAIKEFGWTNPILVDRDGAVIAGHGRLRAAEQLGIDRVPTICIEDMTEVQKRAYRLADNRRAELGDWDPEVLAVELQGLHELEPDFALTSTGFEMGEIDGLIGELNDEVGEQADRLPTTDVTVSPIARRGDLWHLGRHRVLCADATESKSFEKLMTGEQAQMIFADPPYNLRIDQISGLGASKHSEFAMASGEMSEAEFTAFLQKALSLMAANSVDGAIHFICMDWRHLFELLSAARSVYSEYKNLCVWVKRNGGMGSLYRSRHELVAVFKKGSAPHINNVELGRHGRYRSNVWVYGGMNSFGAERAETLAMHPTVKPIALVEDAILDCSDRGGLILDTFVGSGTTLLAAERVGRRCFGLELEPRYVDLTLHRFLALTEIEPLHINSGLTLKELEKTRRCGSTESEDSTEQNVALRKIR